MINQAFTQWSLDPVITTLETINAPIEDIQFPTVTVCDQKPADNWGPIEKVFNPLAFECRFDWSNPLSNDCQELTKAIRKDFKFLIASIIETFIGYLNEIDYKTLTEAPMFKGQITNYNQSGVMDIVAEILRQGKDEVLIELAIQKFATDMPIVKGIDYIFGKDYTTDAFINCTSKICKDNQENAVRFLITLEWTKKGIPFGSFITQFIRLNNYKSFGSCRHDLCLQYNDTNFDCTKLDENENILHEYFALLSKHFGFNDSEILSLYELPGMLADNLDYRDASSVDGKIESDFLLGDIPQAYMYSDCKEREHINFTINYSTTPGVRESRQFQQCYWSEEKLNETGMYIHSMYLQYPSHESVYAAMLHGMSSLNKLKST